MAARTCRLSNDMVWLSYPGEHKQLGVFFLLNRTQVKRILLAGCLAAALTVALAACARDKTPSASQGGNPVNSSSSAGDQEDEATEESEAEATIEVDDGILKDLAREVAAILRGGMDFDTYLM